MIAYVLLFQYMSFTQQFAKIYCSTHPISEHTGLGKGHYVSFFSSFTLHFKMLLFGKEQKLDKILHIYPAAGSLKKF